MEKPAFSLAVYSTQDYSVFTFMSGNRDRNKVQVKRLAKLIATNPEFTKLSPILVNEKMEIIDGQHRVEAFMAYSKETGQTPAIYYVKREGLTLNDARSLNSGSKPWSPKDYAEAYKKMGNKNYALYLAFLSETGLNYDILARYLSPSDYSVQGFREGKFTVSDAEKSKLWFKQLDEVGAAIDDSMVDPIDWDHRSFALALLEVMESPEYEQTRMVSQIEAHARLLRTVDMRTSDMATALQKIYNKGHANRVLLLA